MFKNDLILIQRGKYFDAIEITPECGYVNDTIEPFLDLKLNNNIGKQKLRFTDDQNRRHDTTVKDMIDRGMKVYYHDQLERVDLTKVPGTRAPGMATSALDEIEIVLERSRK